jgi:biotin operon repressor BirA-like protein
MTTDAKILSALRANPDGVSGAQLAEQLKISRAAIWSRIEELRQLDYDIEASPHFGYRLVSSPDALHADDLLARLNCFGWGGRPHEPQSSKSKRLAGTLAPPRFHCHHRFAVSRRRGAGVARTFASGRGRARFERMVGECFEAISARQVAAKRGLYFSSVVDAGLKDY